MRKFFPAKPLERILVQRAGWNDQRPDLVDAELAGHRERKRLTHTVVVAKRLLDEAQLFLVTVSVVALPVVAYAADLPLPMKALSSRRLRF
ncbi:MAG: hypothetical protein WCB55_05165 [Pseudolabrys sp.]